MKKKRVGALCRKYPAAGWFQFNRADDNHRDFRDIVGGCCS